MLKQLIIREHPDSRVTLDAEGIDVFLYVRNGKGKYEVRVELKKTEVKQLIKNLVDVLGKM